ncbi:SubName: Full=Uncharacterized protein {ECO:0000313/EMBL:CCA71887.1} [Serendipita indica DSM 11827]|nr:SubName: Full=Uncharacterized protein {ECO:0000313/EMBL:CCA71887.1} [Serendipita indica DSM 11827]
MSSPNPALIEDIILEILHWIVYPRVDEKTQRLVATVSLVCRGWRVHAQRILFRHIRLSRLESLLYLQSTAPEQIPYLRFTETLTIKLNWCCIGGSRCKKENKNRVINVHDGRRVTQLVCRLPLMKTLHLDICQLHMVQLTALRAWGSRNELGRHVRSLRISAAVDYSTIMCGPELWQSLENLEVEENASRPLNGPTIYHPTSGLDFQLQSLTLRGIHVEHLRCNPWLLGSSRDTLLQLTLIHPAKSRFGVPYSIDDILCHLGALLSLTLVDYTLTAHDLNFLKTMGGLRELRLFKFSLEVDSLFAFLPKEVENICLDIPCDLHGMLFDGYEPSARLKTVEIVVSPRPGKRVDAWIAEARSIWEEQGVVFKRIIGDVPRDPNYPPRKIKVELSSADSISDVSSISDSSEEVITGASDPEPVGHQGEKPTKPARNVLRELKQKFKRLML